MLTSYAEDIKCLITGPGPIIDYCDKKMVHRLTKSPELIIIERRETKKSFLKCLCVPSEYRLLVEPILNHTVPILITATHNVSKSGTFPPLIYI